VIALLCKKVPLAISKNGADTDVQCRKKTEDITMRIMNFSNHNKNYSNNTKLQAISVFHVLFSKSNLPDS